MAKIKVIDYNESKGTLREIYDEIIKKRKKLAEVHKIQSLRPKSIAKHMDLYMEIMFTKSELSRAEREMVAVIVSITNGCEYCATHHGEALLAYWKDESKLKALKSQQFELLNLSEKEQLLCKFAEHVTKNPQDQNLTDSLTNYLRKAGLTDEGILDLVLVVSYFNFVNRIVLSLGVQLESDGGKDYHY